jgi:signal transduction histidine kinase
MRKPKTLIVTIIVIITITMFTTLWFSLDTIREINNSLEKQVHTRTTIITLKDNLHFLLGAETGERGFLITGDPEYLEPYEEALENISITTDKLRWLIDDDPEQIRNLDTLELYIDEQLDRLSTMIAMKKQNNDGYIKDALRKNEGKIFMDRIRRISGKMQAKEIEMFSERQLITSRSIVNAEMVFIGEAIFSLLVTLFLAILIVTELNRRARAEKVLSEMNFELQSKNKEIEQFAFVASHDLQEPLRTISTFTSLLAAKVKDNSDPKIQEYSQTVMAGTKRMSALIYDLLEYSRIGKDARKTRIDCNKLVKEVLSDMDTALKDNHAKIVVGDLPTVTGYGYLKSLFQNLLSNALKFQSKEQRPEVSINASDDGRDHIFKIRDNGIGIEKDFQERIFLMFQRLHARTEYPGTGIGLAHCKKIVELHGGKIWVESEPGKGSIFVFTIPKSKP